MRRLFAIICFSLALTSCGAWLDPIVWAVESQRSDDDPTWYAAGFFASSLMTQYYLWDKEIEDDLAAWMLQPGKVEPISKVKEIRYKENGKDYDRWTELTDDISSLENSFAGISTTYGCSIVLKRESEENDKVLAIISVVYDGSPAKAAGLKRGDIIVSVAGTTLDLDNYYDLVTGSFIYAPSCTIGLRGPDGTVVEKSMTAVTMYEDPVVCHKVFNIFGKKVGYLCYTSFVFKSMDKLVEVFQEFKEAGICELILDLRYNGGGYVTVEQMIASVLAPRVNVAARDILETSVYNETLTKMMKKESGDEALISRFSTSFSYEEDGEEKTFDTSHLNLGITRIYGLIDSGTASASESLLVCLMPYIDVVTIGGRSHGKFCSGILFEAKEWYDEVLSSAAFSTLKNRAARAENWGMYLMVGSYGDRNGNNPCRPNGLTPAYAVDDVPENGAPLGEEEEPLLRQALILAGRIDLVPGYGGLADRTRSSSRIMEDTPLQVRGPLFGKRIISDPL